MTNVILEFHNVSKVLGKRKVLDNINVTIAGGEVVGIVGANGSGKTTLLRMVTGMMYPDQGEVKVEGKKVQPGMLGELPISIGALIEHPAFLPQFSGLKNLSFLAGIRNQIDISKIRETITRVGLDPDNRKGVKTYSLGMRQRLGIAQAIMEEPRVLLFDEPTNGLDQEGVKIFGNILEEQTMRGAAIILVSHVQEEINLFCDKVYMIQNGRLELVRANRERQWIVLTKDLQDLDTIYHQLPNFEISKRVDGFPAGICKGEWESKEELNSLLVQNGIRPVDIREVG